MEQTPRSVVATSLDGFTSMTEPETGEQRGVMVRKKGWCGLCDENITSNRWISSCHFTTSMPDSCPLFDSSVRAIDSHVHIPSMLDDPKQISHVQILREELSIVILYYTMDCDGRDACFVDLLSSLYLLHVTRFGKYSLEASQPAWHVQ